MWGVDYEKPMITCISTVVLNDLQSKFGTAPAAEESERQNAAQLLFLSCLCSEKEVGTQVSLVTMSHPLPENCCSTCFFTTGYKRLTEGRQEVFFF
jgi:hypothetical protein